MTAVSHMALLATYTGGDPYFSNVQLLLHMDGTDGSTTIIDHSQNAFSPTVFGNAQIDTAQSKFGGASLLLDGTGDYLSYADNAAFALGSGDFTIEFWARPNGLGAGDFNMLTHGDNGGWMVRRNGSTVTFYASTGNAGTTMFDKVGFGTLSNLTWHHIAVTRQGTTFRGFLDGVMTSFGTSSLAIWDPTVALQVGALAGSTGGRFNGWIDDVRLTVGAARYTAAFTPPAETFLDF